jgi:phenylpropionate dioxygenase-like ring-hydroxylating dioxygenase large terminal subunit
MDATMAADVRDRFVFERGRTAPPTGFPDLPDIPLARYTDEAFFTAEIDRVFRGCWHFAGHDSEWDGPGSFRVLDLPYAPVVVTRGRDGQLRAFLNSCRHRGAPVVRASEGKATLLVCQFHSWAYDLEGRLVRVQEERDFVNICKGDRSLTPVRCETWAGFVFVNLMPDAQPLSEWLAPIDSRFADLMGAPYQYVTRKSYDFTCNWKVLVEAFIEAYHVETIHSQSAAPFLDNRAQVIMLHPNGHSSMFAPRAASMSDAGSAMVEMFYPPDLPRVTDIPDIYYEDSTTSFSVFPNLLFPVDVNGFPLFVFTPVDVRRTRLDLLFYGLDWGGGPRPPGWDIKLGAWDVLMAEDMLNMEPIQRSIEAAAHRGVPLSYQERRIWHLHAELDRWLGDAVPADLRIPDLLAEYVEP